MAGKARMIFDAQGSAPSYNIERCLVAVESCMDVWLPQPPACPDLSGVVVVQRQAGRCLLLP